LAVRRFLNVVHAVWRSHVAPEGWEEFDAWLASPLPGEVPWGQGPEAAAGMMAVANLSRGARV
jgi:hypothetical protein